MEFFEIKKKFEHKSYFERSRFIEEYHFQDDFQDYYRSFILNNLFKIKTPGYLTDLIWLAADLEFYDEEFYDQIKKLLESSDVYLIQLIALDYIRDRNLLFYDINLLPFLKHHLKVTKFESLKCQILVTILILRKQLALSNKDVLNYWGELMYKIAVAKKWYYIQRTINFFDNESSYFEHLKEYQDTLMALVLAKCHKKMGKGIDGYIQRWMASVT